MTLILVEGLTHAEAAARLEITVGAVEKQAARGRRLLGERLAWIVGDPGAASCISAPPGGEGV